MLRRNFDAEEDKENIINQKLSDTEKSHLLAHFEVFKRAAMFLHEKYEALVRHSPCFFFDDAKCTNACYQKNMAFFACVMVFFVSRDFFGGPDNNDTPPQKFVSTEHMLSVFEDNLCTIFPFCCEHCVVRENNEDKDKQRAVLPETDFVNVALSAHYFYHNQCGFLPDGADARVDELCMIHFVCFREIYGYDDIHDFPEMLQMWKDYCYANMSS